MLLDDRSSLPCFHLNEIQSLKVMESEMKHVFRAGKAQPIDEPFPPSGLFLRTGRPAGQRCAVNSWKWSFTPVGKQRKAKQSLH